MHSRCLGFQNCKARHFYSILILEWQFGYFRQIFERVSQLSSTSVMTGNSIVDELA